jgi:peptide/nickel transport system permease protein
MALLLRRLGTAIPLLFLVSALVFVLVSFVPGDAAETILGPPAFSHLPPSSYAELRRELNLNSPLPAQYWLWLSNAIHGDLGESFVTRQPITQAIQQRFPLTLSLAAGALLVSCVLGVALGVLSSIRSGGIVGKSSDTIAMVGWMLPVYWIAAELIVIFAVKLRWLPAEGYVPFTQSPVDWGRSLVLPVFALAIAPIGIFAKFTRDAMMDALGSEYIRIARANGIPERSIVFRHAFKSASLQIVTQAGLIIINLLVATVFVETVFAMPGLGSMLVSGVTGHDIPAVQGVCVFFALIIVIVNLVVDLIYGLLNPKVRVG